MKRLIIPVAAIIVTGYYSCSDNEETKNTEKTTIEVKTQEKCTYTYNPADINVRFVSYKHTKRVEVGGQFDSIIVEGNNSANSIKELLEGKKYRIFVSSLNTNDQGRNEKIKKFFFGVMKNTNEITGEILTIEGDDKEGKGKLNLNMNDIKNEIPFNYVFNNNELTIEGTIDINLFNGGEAIKSLNEACKGLHTGEDGVTKLWPDVKFVITSTIKKECETIN